MKTAAAYIRVSTDDQVEYSPDSQLRLIKDYAARNGFYVPDAFIFADEGVSGRTARRPAFSRMIALAKTKPSPFGAILVYSFSRFARNREDSIVYKRMLRRDLGIDVISVTQDFGDSKAAIITEALFEAMDEYYSIDLGENVRRGMAEKARRGEIMTAPPLGYLVERNRFVPDPDTAPLILCIFEDFAAGMGYSAIARKLNSLGHTTKLGNKFTNRAVKDILRNNTYAGMLSWSAEGRRGRRGHQAPVITARGSHPPLVPAELWERVQARADLLEQMYGHKAKPEAKSDFMLRGLLGCSNCGATLVLNRKTATLQCHRYTRGQCQISHAVALRLANAAVIGALRRDLPAVGLRLAPPPPGTQKGNSAAIETQINRERAKLARIKAAYEAGVDTLEEYQHRKSALLQTIAALESMLTPAPAEPGGALYARFAQRYRTIPEILESDAVDETAKNRLLRSIIRRITYLKPENALRILYYC